MNDLGYVFAVMESAPLPTLARMLREGNRILKKRLQAERESNTDGSASDAPGAPGGCDY
jgi:hypothetical protein